MPDLCWCSSISNYTNLWGFVSTNPLQVRQGLHHHLRCVCWGDEGEKDAKPPQMRYCVKVISSYEVITKFATTCVAHSAGAPRHHKARFWIPRIQMAGPKHKVCCTLLPTHGTDGLGTLVTHTPSGNKVNDSEHPSRSHTVDIFTCLRGQVGSGWAILTPVMEDGAAEGWWNFFFLAKILHLRNRGLIHLTITCILSYHAHSTNISIYKFHISVKTPDSNV